MDGKCIDNNSRTDCAMLWVVGWKDNVLNFCGQTRQFQSLSIYKLCFIV